MDQYQLRKILSSLAATNMFASACDWAANDFYEIAASRMAKRLRYDLYYSQVKKLFKSQRDKDTLDLKKSQLAFNMKDIDEQISVLHRSIGHYGLKTVQAKFVALASLLMLFFFSWKLTLFIIGLQLFTTILGLCLERKSVRQEK